MSASCTESFTYEYVSHSVLLTIDNVVYIGQRTQLQNIAIVGSTLCKQHFTTRTRCATGEFKIVLTRDATKRYMDTLPLYLKNFSLNVKLHWSKFRFTINLYWHLYNDKKTGFFTTMVLIWWNKHETVLWFTNYISDIQSVKCH